MTVPADAVDAETQAKADEKSDDDLEKDVVQWIEAVTGEQIGALTLAEWLNDGLLLCNLVNTIKPGTIKRPNTMKAPVKKMENIAWFTEAARALGVPASASFATADLYEENDLSAVLRCLRSLASAVRASVPEFQGPTLGGGMLAAATGARRSVIVTVVEEGVEAPGLMKKQLRDHMISLLLGAVHNGKLDECASSVAAVVRRERAGGSEPAASSAAGLRARMLKILAESCESGHLEEIVRAGAGVGPLRKKPSRLFE